MWNIENDRAMMALAMTMTDKPMAVNMSFQREYAEPYAGLRQQFVDIAFTYLTAVLYYEDYDRMLPEQRLLMQQGMEAFGGIVPTYRIALLDKPIRICKHCLRTFVASRQSAVFCSPQCKNKYNVYKSRAKDKKEGKEG